MWLPLECVSIHLWAQLLRSTFKEAYLFVEFKCHEWFTSGSFTAMNHSSSDTVELFAQGFRHAVNYLTCWELAHGKSQAFFLLHVCCKVLPLTAGFYFQDIAPDWWRRMARISMDSPNSLPGIPLSVLSVPMENKYKCQQCLQVLRKPVQAQCGHRFCVHCFKQLTRYTGGPQTTHKRVKCKTPSLPNASTSYWTCFSTSCVLISARLWGLRIS